jgi:hypothetical protein
MKIKICLIGGVVLLALAASAWAADVTGKWVAQVEGRNGTTEYTFNFKMDGAKLTGTMATDQGESEITEGKVEGDQISFVIVRSFGGNEMKLLYKGTVSGDEIKFTREMQGGMMMGGPGGAGAPGGGMGGPPGGAGGPGGGGGARPGREFVAKRAK